MSMIRTHVKAWESVPRAAAEDLRMSCQSRGVLFWLLTRPADWQVRIGAMMRLTGLTKHTWPKVRAELISSGYLTAKKGRSIKGKIEWSFDVYSLSTIPPSPALRGMVNRGMADEPSPALQEMVEPSMVKRVTIDTLSTDTVINKEAHTLTPLPPLGEKEGQGQSPFKTLTKTLTSEAVAKLVKENPGLSLRELKTLKNRFCSESEATL